MVASLSQGSGHGHYYKLGVYVSIRAMTNANSTVQHTNIRTAVCE